MARNKYPEVTVEKILDVSQRLFLEKGYDATTIQDIVDDQRRALSSFPFEGRDHGGAFPADVCPS